MTTNAVVECISSFLSFLPTIIISNHVCITPAGPIPRLAESFSLTVQDSSISDIVSQSVSDTFWFHGYNDYNDSNDYFDYIDSDLDLDLDWERFSELVTLWLSDTVEY